MKKTIMKFIMILLMITFSLGSCLNKVDYVKSAGIAEFSEVLATGNATVEREIPYQSRSESFILKVCITTNDPLDKDTKVTLALDNSLIDLYNAENKLTGASAAVPLPLAALTIASYDVTIPIGSINADWTFMVDATKLPDPDAFYVIPVKISGAENDIIPGDFFSQTLVRIIMRNEFDGRYLMKGFIMRTGDTGGLEGYFSGFEYSLYTVKGNIVNMNSGQRWANGGLVGDIDQGWTIRINNSTPAPSYPITLTDLTQGSDFKMVAGYPSRYDTVSNTFFWSVQWGTANPKNRGCTDTLVYVGPR